MALLDCVEPKYRAESIATIRSLLGTGNEVQVALSVMGRMIEWGATPANAAELVLALFEAARSGQA